MYDKQTAKKGSDEFISMLAMQIKKHVPSDMPEMLVHFDGCTGKAWNKIFPLLLEEILNVDSSKQL